MLDWGRFPHRAAAAGVNKLGAVVDGRGAQPRRRLPLCPRYQRSWRYPSSDKLLVKVKDLVISHEKTLPEDVGHGKGQHGLAWARPNPDAPLALPAASGEGQDQPRNVVVASRSRDRCDCPPAGI
jgi:hypothetical protein